MGRNDLCFCNSGKKKKKCHPEVHEESQAACKLEIYGKLQEEQDIHDKISEGISLCAEGCTDCCHDYFTIQDIEFDLILDELSKWDEDKLNNLINRVKEYWTKLVDEQPMVNRLLENISNAEINEINSKIEKTSFPCVFLNEDSGLCQIYNIRPFKCRVFGKTYYQEEQGAMAIACQKYGRILDDDNFNIFFFDVTKILDKNTDLAIIQDKKQNIAMLELQYPLIFKLYDHFIVKKLGTTIDNYDEKFKLAKSTYYNKIIKNKTL